MRRYSFAFVIIVLLATLVWLMYDEYAVPIAKEVACTAEAKICPDGSTVGRQGPQCEFALCPEVQNQSEVTNDPVQTPVQNDLISIDAPLQNAVISSPVIITGKARGIWFFEGSFPISIVNWDGLIIGEGIAQAQSEWMTEDFVPFIASITFDFNPETPYNQGAIILKKDNPSGLPEHDNAIEFPILFTKINVR